MLEIFEAIDSANDKYDELNSALEKERRLSEELKTALKEKETLKQKESIYEVASQVAHDIRSPLTAFEVVLKEMESLREDQVRLARMAVSRVRDIANNLLSKHRPSTPLGEKLRSASVEHLPSLIFELVTEKRLQYKANYSISLEFDPGHSEYGLFAKVDSPEFKRVLSNLVDNAFAAISQKGKITLSLARSADQVEIQVRDTGAGIPPEVLQRLGKDQISTKGERGHGLGLTYCFQTIENSGGTIEIHSQVGKGTQLAIRLQACEAPEWFSPQLSTDQKSKIVIIDNDPSIHELWRRRLQGFSENKVQILFFLSASEWKKYLGSNEFQSSALYLVDYDLGEKETGLDIIEKHRLHSSSILVTHHWEREEVRENAKHLGVRIVPKSMISVVPVFVGVSTI